MTVNIVWLWPKCTSDQNMQNIEQLSNAIDYPLFYLILIECILTVEADAQQFGNTVTIDSMPRHIFCLARIIT